ncbi:NAD(P)-bd-dom domain-containing protein [Fusarium keratoplasticum]|uniref:NAD(P)-bd-dom domain-containing protein n=1 Tax=Fusarium keratoplasticum TaxID=1328300 RepID=A0ACC0R6V2_9HYPO|nr:NAD(P)-bd-dom domain-containing protein [Fusarium keratoplasticum]KAI8675968.1 NAD(P)-bd-dom domain-containing protein [Fusarium keratoplasticum]
MPSADSAVVKSVALAGAGGHLGRQVLEALLKEQSFDVTVLASRGRKPIDYPSGARVALVDYESPESLQDALREVGAVVSALGKKTGLECQLKLIDAAVAAGVKRFIPSEFGADLQNPKIRAFPTYRTKVQTEEYLEKLAKENELTYTYIYNSLLLDDGLDLNVFADFTAWTVNIYDGGDTAFSTTSISTVARAVVAVLSNFEATRNRAIRIQDLSTTPRDLLQTLQRLDPGHDWTPVAVDTEVLVKKAEDDLASGIFSPRAFAAFATRATFAPGFASTYDTDMDRLGLTEMTRDEFEGLLRERLV